MNETNNVPEKKFSSGALSVTVWQNEGKTNSGEDTVYKTVTFQRRYKDKNGDWQSTSTLRVNDLPKAALILGKAYEYMVMRESEVA